MIAVSATPRAPARSAQNTSTAGAGEFPGLPADAHAHPAAGEVLVDAQATPPLNCTFLASRTAAFTARPFSPSNVPQLPLMAKVSLCSSVGTPDMAKAMATPASALSVRPLTLSIRELSALSSSLVAKSAICPLVTMPSSAKV